jgi:hypothetical protein
MNSQKKAIAPRSVWQKILTLLIFSFPLLIGVFYQSFTSLISSNLPFREAYQPSILGLLLTYVFPFLFGILVFSKIDKSKVKTSFYYVNLALITTFLIAIPFLLSSIANSKYWFNFDVSVYFFILFIVLFLLGGATTGLRIAQNTNQNEHQKNHNFTRFDLLLCTCLTAIVFALNLFPVSNSKYLIGADVYYHAAMSQHIYDGGSLQSSPFFKEGKNYYFSIGYYLMAYISKISHTSLNTLWLFYTPILSAGFTLFFYLLIKRIFGDWRIATLATLLVIPYREILWSDVSLKGLALFFFSIFLFTAVSWIIKRKKIYFILACVFFLLAGASHPEIALHATGIVSAYLFLSKTPVLTWILKWIRRPNKSHKNTGFYWVALDSVQSFSILLFMTSLLFVQQMLYALRAFPHGKTCIFNEIPLSLCQPIGVVSMLPFLFAIIAIVLYFNVRQKEHVFIISISSLFFVTVFYFSHMWGLYHRYFAETAYFGFVGLACLTFHTFPYKSRLFLSGIGLFVFASIYPKALFVNEYSQAINSSLNYEKPTFNLIKENTTPHSVILLRPSEIINRHIPFYTDRYIVGGNNKITKEVQWQVLSTCNGPFEKDCDRRIDLSQKFFSDPTPSTLQNLETEYEVDYMLIGRDDPDLAIFGINKLPIKQLASNQKYIIYEVKK